MVKIVALILICLFVSIYLIFMFIGWQIEKHLPENKFSKEIVKNLDIESTYLDRRSVGGYTYTGKLRNIVNLYEVLKKDSTFEYFDNCIIIKQQIFGNYDINSDGKNVDLIQFHDDSPPNFKFNLDVKYKYFRYRKIERFDTEGYGQFLLSEDGKFGYVIFRK